MLIKTKCNTNILFIVKIIINYSYIDRLNAILQLYFYITNKELTYFLAICTHLILYTKHNTTMHLYKTISLEWNVSVWPSYYMYTIFVTKQNFKKQRQYNIFCITKHICERTNRQQTIITQNITVMVNCLKSQMKKSFTPALHWQQSLSYYNR